MNESEKSQLNKIETDGERAYVKGGGEADAVYRKADIQRLKEDCLYC